MYAYIKGTLEEVGEDAVTVEAGGIGYNIRVSTTTADLLPGLAAKSRYILTRWCGRTHFNYSAF